MPEFNNNGVSVICLSYNMENYIRDALEGFIMQRVNFPLEVIIHDDASTDKSAEIIREYVEKYPDLFVPILQTENQYSKGVVISKELMYPLVRGKYIAYCEGDDYWTDPDKLQKQYDFLEAHPEYSFCAHASRRIDISGGTPDKIIGPLKESGTVDTPDIIYKNAQTMYTTFNSMLFRFADALARPQDMYVPRIGDKPTITWLATLGPMYYFAEEMSVYRYHHPTSWTAKNHFAGSAQKIRLIKSYLPIYPAALRHMNGNHRDCIERSLLLLLQRLMVRGISLDEIRSGELKEYYDMLSLERQKSLANYRMKAPFRRVLIACGSIVQNVRSLFFRRSSAKR